MSKARREEVICTCGAGHGSGYGHTDWCDWTDHAVRRRRPRIETAGQYTDALRRIGALMRDETELRELVDAVHAYEAETMPPDPPSAVDAIKFRMEQMGLQPRDLEDIFGQRGKLSEVLNGKRGLSITMIRKLRQRLGIPADVLIGIAEDAE